MTLFGPNLVDIEGKSTLSLLIDEVRVCPTLTKLVSCRVRTGHPSLLRIPDCEHRALVTRRLLLLCVLHCPHLSYQYHYYLDRNQAGTCRSFST